MFATCYFAEKGGNAGLSPFRRAAAIDSDAAFGAMTPISVSPACTMPEETMAWDHSLRDSLVRKMVSCGRWGSKRGGGGERSPWPLWRGPATAALGARKAAR